MLCYLPTSACLMCSVLARLCKQLCSVLARRAAEVGATCCAAWSLWDGESMIMPTAATAAAATYYGGGALGLSCLPACLLLLHCPYYLCCGASCCW